MSVAAVKQLCTPNAIVTQPNRAGGGGRRTYLGEVLVGDFSDAEFVQRRPCNVPKREDISRKSRWPLTASGVRRDKAALSSGCKSHPATLQPEAAGAAMEVTK